MVKHGETHMRKEFSQFPASFLASSRMEKHHDICAHRYSLWYIWQRNPKSPGIKNLPLRTAWKISYYEIIRNRLPTTIAGELNGVASAFHFCVCVCVFASHMTGSI